MYGPLKGHVGNSEILFRSLEIYFVPSKYISRERNIFRGNEIYFAGSVLGQFFRSRDQPSNSTDMLLDLW